MLRDDIQAALMKLSIVHEFDQVGVMGCRTEVGNIQPVIDSIMSLHVAEMTATIERIDAPDVDPVKVEALKQAISVAMMNRNMTGVGQSHNLGAISMPDVITRAEGIERWLRGPKHYPEEDKTDGGVHDQGAGSPLATRRGVGY